MIGTYFKKLNVPFYAKCAFKKSIIMGNKQNPKKLQRLNLFISFMDITRTIALYAIQIL